MAERILMLSDCQCPFCPPHTRPTPLVNCIVIDAVVYTAPNAQQTPSQLNTVTRVVNVPQSAPGQNI